MTRWLTICLLMILLPNHAFAGWELSYEDNFLDTKKLENDWEFEEGFRRNKEIQYYVPEIGENLEVRDGELIIRGKRGVYENSRYKYGSDDWRKKERYSKFTSASIKMKRPVVNGRIEVVAKAPKGHGLLSAIWVSGISREFYGEIDLMEILGRKPDLVYTSYHTGPDLRSKKIHQFRNTFTGLSEKYAVYVLELTPDRVKVFVDDKNVLDIDRNQEDQTGYFLPLQQGFRLTLNLGMGGKWPKELDESVLPAEFKIKSVRIWDWTP